MDAYNFIVRMRREGFSVREVDGQLGISPASRLDDEQREWISANKAAILTALRSVGTMLESGQAGNDLEPANDRVVVHVPEHTVTSGNRYSFDLDLPRKHLDGLRAVVRFRLKDDQGGGSVLGEPGMPREALVADLQSRYGDRLATIDGENQ
jgi:hypothetical protein